MTFSLELFTFGAFVALVVAPWVAGVRRRRARRVRRTECVRIAPRVRPVADRDGPSRINQVRRDPSPRPRTKAS